MITGQMITGFDVLIVGAGPAGSSSATCLRAAVSRSKLSTRRIFLGTRCAAAVFPIRQSNCCHSTSALSRSDRVTGAFLTYRTGTQSLRTWTSARWGSGSCDQSSTTSCCKRRSVPDRVSGCDIVCEGSRRPATGWPSPRDVESLKPDTWSVLTECSVKCGNPYLAVIW